jgi:hypothetical protein
MVGLLFPFFSGVIVWQNVLIAEKKKPSMMIQQNWNHTNKRITGESIDRNSTGKAVSKSLPLFVG